MVEIESIPDHPVRLHMTLDASEPQRRGNFSHVLGAPEEMAARFAEHPEAVAETVRLSERLRFDLRSDLGYRYPGNVRQLQNAMERAAVFSGASGVVLPEHLPEELRSNGSASTAGASDVLPAAISDEGIDFSEIVSQVEKRLLLRTLDKTGGNKMQAAKLLNLKRTTLVEKIKRLQIDVDDDGAELADAAEAP